MRTYSITIFFVVGSGANSSPINTTMNTARKVGKMDNGNETITAQEASYLRSCQGVVDDLENHVKQCNQELEHYKKMAEFAEKQVLISQDRLLHERTSLANYKKSIGVYENYCTQYNFPYEESKKYPNIVKDTTHYKVYESGLELKKFKTEIKNALPKWLKWLIR